ncbi:MAG: AAA family ATPase [Desulfobulbaceae bacterium]|nr:AAA family ATPase [Desulfobulbaceae bacterium]
MQLKKVYVDGYKNLIQTSVEVQSADIPLAIIGNNGTGKSNLIEALLHIFVGLYYDNPPDFNFHLEYEAHNKNISITRRIDENVYTVRVDGREWSWSYFKRRIRETEQMPPFPALVFSYYSGTCDRTKNLVKKYNRSYQAKIRNQTKDLERLFVFSDVDQAEMCLLGLFAHRHQGLLDRLSLRGMDEFRVTLNPPETYTPEKDDPIYWGTTGAIRDLIASLDNSARESYEPYGKGKSVGLHELRTYVFKTKHLEKVGSVLEDRGVNLFSMLQVLDAKKMLQEIEFNVVHAATGAIYGVEELSEGEKQLLCVIGGLKLSHQKECLVLLDEPDTHLNPAWSWEYDNLLRDALQEKQQKNSTVALATHDPVLISGLTKDQVLIARIIDGRLIYEQPHRNPRGQGVANVLTSEYFGLPSSLDKNTQDLLDERLTLAFKAEPLANEERERLKFINQKLEELGLSISFRDPKYAEFERERYQESRG